MDNFLDLIRRCQNHDTDALAEIVNQFTPLLRKQAKRLNYEDAYEDVQCFFIGLIQNPNLSNNVKKFSRDKILSYIKNSVENYCSNQIKSIISHKQIETLPFSALANADQSYDNIMARMAISNENHHSFEKDIENRSEIQEILAEKEANILTLYYYRGYDEKEIAKRLGVSQSAVSQSKAKGIRKLRKRYAN